MAQLRSEITVRTRWWVPGYLAAGKLVLWVSAPFMTEFDCDAYIDRLVSFIDRHGLEVVAK